jgi:uncharacterized protein YdaU (DUF1376 family)
MAKGADTWMAFYPGAYLANTLHLTRCQHGSYLMLILAAFKAGGVLPNNDSTLAAIARCTPKEWAAERAIYAAFFDVTDEHWTHDRVAHELAKAERLTGQKRIAGLASAAARQRIGNSRPTDVDVPSQRRRKPSEPHPDNLPQGDITTDAASAVGDPSGPPRSQPLPDTAKWAERLAGFRPWEGKATWLPFWGPRPDSMQRNPTLELYPSLLKAWREEYQAAKARGEAA